MRIAMVSEHASPLAALGGVDAGGQNVHVRELARRLADRGHHVTVYTRRDSLRVPDRVPCDGFEVVHVPAGPPEPLPKDELLPYMAEFGDFLAARWRFGSPDLAHAHFWMSGVATVRAAEAVDVPVVQTFHALGLVKRRHQGDRDTSPAGRIEIERELGRAVTKVAATCSDEAFELVNMGVPRDNIGIVPCGVDLDRFDPDGPVAERALPHRIVTVGRLVPRKGFDQLIAALPWLPDTELVIAGGPENGPVSDDPEGARLSRVAAELGVADRVRLLGQVSREDMAPLLRSADVVACTPWYEPFGLIPLEAMACAVPVVVNAVGGLTDTVVDGVTGAHVPPGRTDLLCRAIRPILDQPSLRRQLGAAGRRRVERRYPWQRIADETVRLYERAQEAWCDRLLGSELGHAARAR